MSRVPVSARTSHPSALLQPFLDRLTPMLKVDSGDDFLSGFSVHNKSYSRCLASGVNLELARLGIPIFAMLEDNCERKEAKNRCFLAFQKKPSPFQGAWHQRFLRTRQNKSHKLSKFALTGLYKVRLALVFCGFS